MATEASPVGGYPAARGELPEALAGLTVLVPDGMRVTSRADTAYHLVRDRVVTLALPPGSALSEPELMAELGLGRTPVREALRRLADDGLITILPRRGMVVAPVEAGDLADISEVRQDLEALAARCAAERATAADRARAEALLDELRQVPGSARALIRLDQRVHRWMYAAAHNPFLAGTLDHYLVLSLRLWFLGLDRVTRLDEAVREHRDLIRAVLTGDGDAAATVARGHVRGFQRDISRVLSGLHG
jgi:DNA-binding GntR family transcriptional regulator